MYKSNNMVNKLHEILIIIILNDYTSDFKELLENDNNICNRHRIIQTLLSIIESMSKRRVNTYNIGASRSLERTKNEPFGMI